MVGDNVAALLTCDHRPLNGFFEASPLAISQQRRQTTCAPVLLTIWIDLFDRFEVRRLTHPCTPFCIYRPLVDNNSINYCASDYACVYYIANENKISMLLFQFLTMLFFRFWMIPLMASQKVSTGDYFC